MVVSGAIQAINFATSISHSRTRVSVRASEKPMSVSPTSMATTIAKTEGATRTNRDGVSATPCKQDVSRILGLNITLSVVLAERLIAIESILDVTTGTIIEFDVPFDAELQLRVGNRTIAHGQTVKVGENFGLRLYEVSRMQDRVDALGG